VRKEQIEAILDTLARTPAIVVPLVREMDPSRVKRRLRSRKWSVHEHACHLAAVHPIFFNRLERMLAEEHPRIESYSPDQAEEQGALLKVNLEEALTRLEVDRARLVDRLRQLAPREWERTAEHGEYARYSIYIMFRHVAMHDLFHAYRIEELVLSREWPAE
jgi:uncharacterized damage-inducible protein DinB